MYQSPFKRIPCSQPGIDKIKVIQDAFDELYRGLYKRIGLEKCPELTMALRALQEANMCIVALLRAI